MPYQAQTSLCSSLFLKLFRTTDQGFSAWLLKLFAGRPDCSVPVQPAFPAPYSRWWDDLQGYGFEADRAALLTDLLHRRARRFGHTKPIGGEEHKYSSLSG